MDEKSIIVEQRPGHARLIRQDGMVFILEGLLGGGHSLYPERGGPGIHLNYTIGDALGHAKKRIAGYIREQDGRGSWSPIGD